jgi:hypothetical protein|tara:strand:+ start:235 stop:450 length:216 start_codon:yes stop_codon:yes gene_type:complete
MDRYHMEVIDVNGINYQLKEWLNSNSYGRHWEVKELKKVSSGMYSKFESLDWFPTKASALYYLNNLTKENK